MRRRVCFIYLPFLLLLPHIVAGQDCSILSKANFITPDQFCSPVEVVTWVVRYEGVKIAGTNFQIHFDWNDGDTDIVDASEAPADTYTATSTHTYASEGDRCNYHPVATLIVDGRLCTSSSQEQIVTVWDNDNENGGRVNASPNVYPICIGNGATMQFDDGTLFNCVPPQEEDVPNTGTRWIQWVYGTNISMSGAPVMVDGAVRSYPYTGPVIELPGPVTGSDEKSLPITVADDNLVGEEFEVELRYWNFCNPYPTDPPVTDRSVIRIVDLPDATISPTDTMCQYENNIMLSAASGGGIWSGNGIVNDVTGEFSPSVAGSGNHEIIYQITDDNSCSSSDTVYIAVRAAPEANIKPVDPFCSYDAPYQMEAITPGGNWTGEGIIDAETGFFDPAVAGPGRHQIAFTTDPDANGCIGTDTIELAVIDPPFAEFLTPDSAWCQAINNQNYSEVLISGTDSSLFDLVLEKQGRRVTIRNLGNDTIPILLLNEIGLNQYNLVKIIEHHGYNSCDTDLFDTLFMEVFPAPVMSLTSSSDDLCSPVEVAFEAKEGYFKYSWDFGDGEKLVTPTNQVSHSYRYDYGDLLMAMEERDSTYGNVNADTVFYLQLKVETNFGCSDTVYDSVRVYPNPVADFYVNPEIQSFPDSLIYLINLSSFGNWSYSWDFGDGTSDTLKEPNQHTYDTWGFYDVELKTFSPFCRDSISKRVQILPPPPEASFEPDSLGCPPLDITFRNNSLYAESYIWDFDDGSFSTDPSPTHTFWESKEHHVRLAAYGLSGADTTYQTILIHERPKALFMAYPAEAKNLKQIFKFVNRSLNSSYYLWDFGDGNTSADPNPSHIYSDSGFYSVTLYVWSEHDCPDTLIKEKLIHLTAGEGSTEFPNAFVWNGSGPSGGHWSEGTIDNTVFHPYLENAIDLRMIIYTRWGEMIWETNEVYIGWDGYLKSGELASPGVYVYKAWVTYVDGEQELLTGDVTFLH